MKRSIGVTAAGVLLLIGSALLVLAGVAEVVVLKAQRPPVERGVPAFGMVFDLALAAWGIATAVGVFRLRPWARISILVMGGSAVPCLLLVLVMSFMLTSILAGGPGSDAVWIIRALMLGTLALPLAIAVWWLILFTRRGVKQQFAAAAAAATPPAASKRTRPLSISIIAIWLIATAPVMLLARYLTPGISAAHIPMIVFAVPVHGWKGAIFATALGAASAIVGLGLWWVKPWARIGGVAFCLFQFVNSVALAARPAVFSRALTAAAVARPSLVASLFPSSIIWLIFLPGAPLCALAIWFLVRRKAAFAPA